MYLKVTEYVALCDLVCVNSMQKVNFIMQTVDSISILQIIHEVKVLNVDVSEYFELVCL